MRGQITALLAVGVMVLARPVFAEDCAPGAFCGGPHAGNGQPLPPPSVSDFGVTQSFVSRYGYSSGPKIGGGLGLSYRFSTFPYSMVYGAEMMQIDLLTAVDKREIGFRIAPIGFAFGIASSSLFTNLYIRWNLFEVGADYRTDIHQSRVSFDTALSLGFSLELSEGIALKVIEIGAYGGVYDKEDATIFDWGGHVRTGIVFR